MSQSEDNDDAYSLDYDFLRGADALLIEHAQRGLLWAHRLDRSPAGIKDEVTFAVVHGLPVSGLRPVSQKARARRRVAYEKRMGRLVAEPCAVCGDKKAEAHHANYFKPLDVRWLCRSCHATAHFPLRAVGV
jgi:ribosomal protein S27AE